MRHAPFCTLGLLALAPSAAFAQNVDVTPLVEARPRYERVEQDGLPLPSDAVTVRVRAGVQARSGPFVATVQAQGNLAIDGAISTASTVEPPGP
jgi:hypothetical protein